MDDQSEKSRDIFEGNDSASESSGSRTGAEKSESSDKQNKLTKEEINKKLYVEFAKKPGNKSQHLVPPGETEALCGVGLGSNVPISDTPGPFDPICGNCRRSIGETRGSGISKHDIREWLSNNIDGVEGPDSIDNPSTFKRKEMEAIITYIKSKSTK